MAVFEAVCNQFGDMRFGNVVHTDFLHAFLRKDICQNLSHVLRIAVHGCVCNHDSFFFRFIFAPFIVLADDIVEICTPDRTMERAEHPDIQSGCFL